MDKILIINIGIMVLAVIFLMVMWVKGKKEFVKNTIKSFVKVAEETFLAGDNIAKLDFVLDNILQITDKVWILKIYLTKDRLKKWINEAVDYMQFLEGTTSEKEAAIKKIALNLATDKIQEFTDKIVKADYNGDKNIIDNWKAIDIKKEVLGNLENDFEGVKAKIQTGFTKKTTTAILEFMKKI